MHGCAQHENVNKYIENLEGVSSDCIRGSPRGAEAETVQTYETLDKCMHKVLSPNKSELS